MVVCNTFKFSVSNIETTTTDTPWWWCEKSWLPRVWSELSQFPLPVPSISHWWSHSARKFDIFTHINLTKNKTDPLISVIQMLITHNTWLKRRTYLWFTMFNINNTNLRLSRLKSMHTHKLCILSLYCIVFL